MQFDIKLIALISYIVLNLFNIFIVRTRNSNIVALIASNLLLLLVFALVITNYQLFKELAVMLIIFASIVLLLISDYNPIFSGINQKLNLINISHNKILFLMIFLCFIALFFVAKEIPKISSEIANSSSAIQLKSNQSQLLSRSHPAHLLVEEVYFKNTPKSSVDIQNKEYRQDNQERSALKNKIKNNILFKRITDILLIIVIVINCSLLLYSRCFKYTKNLNLPQ